MELKIFPRNYYAYVSVFIGHLGIFIAAISMTWPSPILSKLNKYHDNPIGRIITSTEQSILGSAPILGSLFGTFYAGHLAKKYGRKPVMFYLAVPTLVAYILMAFSRKIWELYVARILAGFTLGGLFTVNTMYFAEIAENSNRGLLGTAMTCFINFGLLFPLILGPLTNFFWFHIILSVLPAIFMVLVYVFVPESPYYLILRDAEKAEVTLKKLRGIDDVQKELTEIKEYLDIKTESSLRDVLNNKSLRKGILIGCGLILFQQLSGTAIIMSYGQQIFEEAKTDISSDIGPIIIASIQFIVGFITPFVIDRSGRKILLFISHLGIVLAQIPFGVYFLLKSTTGIDTNISWLPLACLILYITTYSLGSGPVPWSIIGEVFPQDVKGVATSLCITVCNISAFILLMSFHFLIDFVGVIFLFFSGCGVLALIFVKFYVVETKGKSLREIQEQLSI